jgi:ABC-type amino acid transport system permease subunit
VSRTLIDVLRSIPPVTWLFLIFFGLPGAGIRLPAVQAAIVGFAFISAAYLAEIYRAGIIAVPEGQWEGARALGLTERDVLRRVIGPQVLRVVVPPAGAYAIGLLKDSSIASTIGVTEIVFRANLETQRTFDGLPIFLAAAVLYIVLSLPFAVLSRGLDRRLRARI